MTSSSHHSHTLASIVEGIQRCLIVPFVLLCLVVVASLIPAQAATPKGATGVQCYAQAAYHEARGQGDIAMKLVQSVTYNRVLDRRWPSHACAVVWQRKQYSWTVDHPTPLKRSQIVARTDREALDRARELATALRAGQWKPTISANHFLSPAALSGGFPAWAKCTESLWATGGCVVYISGNDDALKENAGIRVRTPDFTFEGIWFYTL